MQHTSIYIYILTHTHIYVYILVHMHLNPIGFPEPGNINAQACVLAVYGNPRLKHIQGDPTYVHDIPFGRVVDEILLRLTQSP